jgi:isocitrate dehydrogenase
MKRMSKVQYPNNGNRIIMQDEKLLVPNNPIIPFIEGDGIGADIWKSSVRVFDAAVKKVYGDNKKIHWGEIYAGEKSNDV